VLSIANLNQSTIVDQAFYIEIQITT